MPIRETDALVEAAKSKLFDAARSIRAAADKMYWAVRQDDPEAFKAAMTEYEQVVGLNFSTPDSVIGAAGDKETASAIPSILPPTTSAGDGEQRSFQGRVGEWAETCFPPKVVYDRLERRDRFVEEALELAQTLPDFTADRAHALVDYVFSRPTGVTEQEVGGAMVTLAALCHAEGIDQQHWAEVELTRISAPETIEKIRAKQAAKPVGSALPIASAPSAGDGELVEQLIMWPATNGAGDALSAGYVHSLMCKAAARVKELEEALTEQTDVVDRLCSAIERTEQDIGGESINTVLALLGPANDRARSALNPSPTEQGEQAS